MRGVTAVKPQRLTRIVRPEKKRTQLSKIREPMNLQASARSTLHLFAARLSIRGGLGRLSRISFSNNCDKGDAPAACSEHAGVSQGTLKACGARIWNHANPENNHSTTVSRPVPSHILSTSAECWIVRYPFLRVLFDDMFLSPKRVL